MINIYDDDLGKDDYLGSGVLAIDNLPSYETELTIPIQYRSSHAGTCTLRVKFARAPRQNTRGPATRAVSAKF